VNLEELDGLIDGFRDGVLDDAQIARLDQLLADDPEALDRFVDRARLQADLEFKLGRQPAAPALPATARRSTWKPLLGAAAAAAALLIGVLSLTTKPAIRPSASPSYEGCAVLTRALTPRGIRRLRSGPRHGASEAPARADVGSIQVEFFSGARVIRAPPISS
jgi:hypothetical protein